MKNNSSEAGFTLIELIVVITILGLISAVLIPQYHILAIRSRIRSDIDSVKIVQNQMQIYYHDRGHWPGNEPEEIFTKLVNEDYLNARYLSDNKLILETDHATISYDTTLHQLKLKVDIEDYNIFNHESDKKQWLVS